MVWSTFVPKGRVDFQSFRMRSLRLWVTGHGDKDKRLSRLTAQCFNFQRLRSKASPIHPSFRFDPCVRFFHTFSVSGAIGSEGSPLRNLEMRVIGRRQWGKKAMGEEGNGRVVLKQPFLGYLPFGSSLKCAASSFLRRDHPDPVTGSPTIREYVKSPPVLDKRLNHT